MGKVYWNSPYEDTDHHDEFGYAKGAPRDQRAEAIIAIADHFSGQSKPVLIRKDYSDEFTDLLTGEMREFATCAVTSRDPNIAVRGFEHSVVFEFTLTVRLPPVYNPVSIFEVGASSIAAGPVHPPLERTIELMYGLSRAFIRTDQGFSDWRLDIYRQVAAVLSKMINVMKVEQHAL